MELVVDVMLGVCAALRACHEAGIIHRDLKPANIFLADADTGYEVKVLDFGVSKAPLAGDLTEDGQILGTPQYLSPEQVEGRTVPESDQYALGVLIYVCLTTRLPYEEHQNISLLRAIELGRFAPPRVHRPDLPPGLEAIILQAMHVSPADRFPSVHALGQSLWEFASPNGREHWRSYYFPTSPSARPKDSTTGVPLLAQMGRSSSKGSASSPPHGLAPTEALMPPTPPGRPVVPGNAKHPQAFISTKWARPAAPPAEAAPSAEGSLIDVAGESAFRHSLTGSGKSARRALLLVVGGAAVAAALFAVRGRTNGTLAPASTSSVQPVPSMAGEHAPATRPPEAAPVEQVARPSSPAAPTRTVAVPKESKAEAPVTATPKSPSPESHPMPSRAKRVAEDRHNGSQSFGSRNHRTSAKAQVSRATARDPIARSDSQRSEAKISAGWGSRDDTRRCPHHALIASSARTRTGGAGRRR